MRFPKRAKFDLCCGNMCSSFFSCYLLLAISLSAVTGTIKIQSISVPESVNGNSLEPVNLDCIFELDNSSRESNVTQYLVVKWILNDALIYQWSIRKVFVKEVIKNRILEEQKNLTLGKLTHVPLTILNRTIDLTGLYECQVDSGLFIDSKQKYMIVYVPADTFTLEKKIDEETDTLNITCSAGGLYPKPIISLTANGERIENITKFVDRNEQQLYDIRATFTIGLERLRPFTTFNCSIRIPEVNLTYSKLLMYSKSGHDDIQNGVPFQEEGEMNGADSSGVRYNINLTLVLLSAAWLFISPINRISVDLVKS